MYSELKNITEGKKVLILGMGREGQSSLRVLSTYCNPAELALADSNEKLAEKYESEYRCYFGNDYLKHLDNYDLIINSPGISRAMLTKHVSLKKVRSQTDIFLQLYGRQTIGITGTKGKSTSASLLHSILKRAKKPGILVGNIGLPPFDFLEKINSETIIVFELSSHQLDGINHSPHIALILNIFEEHLDHYGKPQHYFRAKLQIARYQSQNDFLIYNADSEVLESLIASSGFTSQKITFSKNKKSGTDGFLSENGQIVLNKNGDNSFITINTRKALPGWHNAMNALAVACICDLLEIKKLIIGEGIRSFESLPHRLEFVGEFKGIRFYDDSISTIPQASIAAINTLEGVDTLILGGKDRGIDYETLREFIPKSEVRNILCIGTAGNRISALLQKVIRSDQQIRIVNEFSELGALIKQLTQPGKICLLSPAAPSYDWFSNFSERGNAFKKIARNL